MTTALITLSGPGRNLLDPHSMATLVGELRAADAHPDVTAVVITGAGEHFCAGLDIGAIRAGADPVTFARSLVEVLALLPRLTTPVIARVNGDALASGASIVAACDYAVAVTGARLGTVEVAGGIWPMVAQIPLIHRLGARAAMENVGTGEPFTTERARELGLINEFVEPARLDERIRTWVDFAARGGAAATIGRPLFYEVADLPYDQGLSRALDAFAGMFPPVEDVPGR